MAFGSYEELAFVGIAYEHCGVIFHSRAGGRENTVTERRGRVLWVFARCPRCERVLSLAETEAAVRGTVWSHCRESFVTPWREPPPPLDHPNMKWIEVRGERVFVPKCPVCGKAPDA